MGLEKCVWKEVRERNIQGTGTSFPQEIHACDTCNGYIKINCYSSMSRLDKEIVRRGGYDELGRQSHKETNQSKPEY